MLDLQQVSVHFFSAKETNQRKHPMAICFILHLQASKGHSATALRYLLFLPDVSAQIGQGE